MINVTACLVSGFVSHTEEPKPQTEPVKKIRLGRADKETLGNTVLC